MTSEKIRVLTGVGPMRALAHPTRLDLLDLLRVHESLTASRCAELLGLSPKTCSYHLHVLGREGLIEQTAGGPTARERPWRRAYDETQLADAAGDDRELGQARRQVLQTVARRDCGAMLRFAASLDELPEAWQNAVTWHGRTAVMTPAELRDWGLAVEAVTREHVRRAQGEAAERDREPAGRRPVRLLVLGFPDLAVPGGPP
jgi:DNA-binding transcriptional ArsR family regulator